MRIQSLDSEPALTLTSCVSLSKMPYLSGPQFLHLEYDDENNGT